jgi:hypothetical protein
MGQENFANVTRRQQQAHPCQPVITQAVYASSALRGSCSRASLILALAVLPPHFPSPRPDWLAAAMSVQPNAVACNPTLYIVLYCLTPPRISPYSSWNWSPPFPAWGENVTARSSRYGCRQRFRRRRNPSGKQVEIAPLSANVAGNKASNIGSWPLITGHQLRATGVTLCSN